MRHDKLKKELELILLLSDNDDHTVAELSERLNLSSRNLYYYFISLKQAGFNLINEGNKYRLDRRSPFFQALRESVDFTESEAIILRKLLNTAPTDDVQIDVIKRKLDRFYDLKILTDIKVQRQAAHCTDVLYQAVSQRRMVALRNYSSPHSHTVTDRVVEPYMFMNDNTDIRCYEPRSGMNKTFKIARMGNVDMLDVEWMYEDRHRDYHTDVFMFSGEEQIDVKLRMGRLSASLLKEEYPAAAAYIHPDDQAHWIFSAPVCSYLGVGRFVLGLYEDIEIMGDEHFKQYIEETLKKRVERLKP